MVAVTDMRQRVETLMLQEARVEANYKKILSQVMDPETDIDTEYLNARACFIWSVAVKWYLEDQGLDILLQAGSASFQFADPTKKLEGDTHYTYHCESSDHFVEHINTNQSLPEIHAWVVVRNVVATTHVEYVIVDWTTRYLVSLAKVRGLEWTEPSPPKTLVSWPEKCPNGWMYKAMVAPSMFLIDWERKLKR